MATFLSATCLYSFSNTGLALTMIERAPMLRMTAFGNSSKRYAVGLGRAEGLHSFPTGACNLASGSDCTVPMGTSASVLLLHLCMRNIWFSLQEHPSPDLQKIENVLTSMFNFIGAKCWDFKKPRTLGAVSSCEVRKPGAELATKTKMTSSTGTPSLWVTDGLALWCLDVWIGAPW